MKCSSPQEEGKGNCFRRSLKYWWVNRIETCPISLSTKEAFCAQNIDCHVLLLWIYRYMRQRQVSLAPWSFTEPFSDLWSKPSPAPSFLCYPTSVPMLCLLPYQYATAGDIHVWRWADCCILGKILPLFPFLIGTSMVSCLEFAQEIHWVDTGEGVLSIDWFSQETSSSSLMGCFFWGGI